MWEAHKTTDPDGYCGSDLHSAFLQWSENGRPMTLWEAMWPGVRDVAKPITSIHQTQKVVTLSDKVRTLLDNLLWPVGLHKEAATEADSGDLSHVGFFRRWRMNMWK